MSEHEFENWLALLSGLLKLSPEQRQNISDELRSHLEERMEDLIDAGATREEAIAAALEEFGDTAALAHHFTSIAHQQRRRLMRYTYGTIAAVTCAILVLATFWPQPKGPVPNAVAQSEPTESNESDAAQPAQNDAAHSFQGAAASPNGKQNKRELIEDELKKPYGVIEYFQAPLREVIADFGVKTKLPVIIDPQLGDIDLDVPVDLQLTTGWITAKSMLNDFIVKTYIGREYGYVIRDGYIWITFLENTTEVTVYNCRDLLMPTPPVSPEAAPGGEGENSTAAGSSGVATVLTQFGGAAPGGFNSGPDPSASAAAEQQLIEVISNTVASGTWNVAGNYVMGYATLGSIDAINGLIVVKHTREVHEQVEHLLKLLREAKDEHGLDGTIYSYPRTKPLGIGGVGGFGGGGMGGGGGFGGGNQDAPGGGSGFF